MTNSLRHWARWNEVHHDSFAKTRSSLSIIQSLPPQLFVHVCIWPLNPISSNPMSSCRLMKSSIFLWSFLFPPTFSQWWLMSLKSLLQIHGSFRFKLISLSSNCGVVFQTPDPHWSMSRKSAPHLHLIINRLIYQLLEEHRIITDINQIITVLKNQDTAARKDFITWLMTYIQ